MPDTTAMQINVSADFSSDDRYPLIQTLLYDTPLMLSQSKADVLHNVLQGYSMGKPPAIDAAAFQSGVRDKSYAITTGGVAVISVYGTLAHRAGFLDAMSGLTSYRRLHAQLREAEKDADVKAILLDVDSPGGSVAGLFELTTHIKNVSESKPIWSISNESMFSAAYAIGAATQKIIMPRSAMAGSIGVIMMHLDQSKANEKAGKKYTPIYAGYHKIDGSSHEPLSKQAKTTYQHIVDDAYELFTSHVADGRPMSQQDVIDTQAQIYTAPDALDVGLIDQIASYDEALNLLEAQVSAPASFNLAAASHTTESNMTTETKGAELQFSQSDLDAARATGKEEGLQAGIDQERTRVTAILDNEKSAANYAQAANAVKTGLTVEQATGVLASMPDKPALAGNAFVAAMDAQGNPDISAGGGDDAELTDLQLAKQAVSYYQS